MQPRNVRLVNFGPEKVLHSWLCRNEADRMTKAGLINRISRRKDPKIVYQFSSPPPAAPSNVDEDMTQITATDMRALAGHIIADEMQVERLIGHNLLPQGYEITRPVFVDENGVKFAYLRRWGKVPFVPLGKNAAVFSEHGYL